MMRLRANGLLIGVLTLGSAVAAAAPRAPLRARYAVELDDPVGDVGPVETGPAGQMESKPGFDMRHLSIKSDGRQLTIAVTLTEPPGARAGRAVDFYIDTDNDAKTGARLEVEHIGGFEYFLQLDSCVAYDDHMGRTCGVSRKAKATANDAAVQLQRYKGTEAFDKEPILDDRGYGPTKASVMTPVTGTLLQAAVDYQDLKVKAGQAIRIVAGEWTKRKPGSKNDPDFCPEILLTLK